MFIVSNYGLAVLLCVVTMFCWGLWGNTRKLASKTWRYEFFYWDYVIVVLLCSLLLAFTLGSVGDEGRPFLGDLSQATAGNMGLAFLGGVIFNLSNILLSADISLCGMPVAFPVVVGLALLIGVFVNYVASPQGNHVMSFLGVMMTAVAVVLNGIAYKKAQKGPQDLTRKGVRQETIQYDSSATVKMLYRVRCVIALTLFLLLSSAQHAVAQNVSRQSLYDNFVNPPSSSYPRVWWHWMNGNITKDGIRKDLLWMKRSGIGGFHVFDAGLATPQIVDHRLAYMTPEWKDAFKYAIELGDSLGLEMTIASSPGWSETGGPWVRSEDGMKRLEWRTVDVVGGKKVTMRLPEGYDNYGFFLNSTYAYITLDTLFRDKKFYRDIAVLAVRLPDSYKSLAEMNPVITTSGGRLTVEQLSNDDIMDFTTLEPDKDGRCWVQFEFPEKQTVRSLTFSELRMNNNFQNISRDIYKSDDGKNFQYVDSAVYQGNAVRTHNIPETTSKYLRVCFRNDIASEPRNIKVSMLIPSVLNVVEAAGDKGAFTHYRLVNNYPTPSTQCATPIDDVVDVTRYVRNGVLTWKAPQGRWRILRFGYGLTGKINHPASPEATGLEVDKMDARAIKDYYDNYIGTYIDATGGLVGKKGISYVLNDSYEAGPQTWTGKMLMEFKQRRGYDLTKWLPALTGIILNSSEETDRFLFDWRTVIGEMITDYHYDGENDILAKYNLKRYTESHENFRAIMADGMDCKRHADVPMSAVWVHYDLGMTQNMTEEADVRESASVAHIYGQNIVAAESFTARAPVSGAFLYHPENLKRTADFMMAAGLNRFVVHESAHQPVDDKFPGLGLAIYGQWYDRHEAWADQAWAWNEYLSRSCYLLQQGRYVADVAVFYGENVNITGAYRNRRADVPDGYSFDYANTSVLNDMLKIEGKTLTTATGMRYKALFLQNNDYMSVPVLRRICEIADAGVLIYGQMPTRMANLKGSREEFDRLVSRIWKSGKTNVSTHLPDAVELEAAGIPRDVEWQDGMEDVKFVHRTLPEGDIYWVSNVNDNYRTIDLSFNVTGRKPVVWRAETATVEPVEYAVIGGRTSVKLNMVPHDALFVMFLEPTTETRHVMKSTFEAPVMKITSPWNISFPENRGAPASVTMKSLASLTESEQPGVRYFSGTSTYTTTFNWNGERDGHASGYYLDLGEVHDIAEVTLNGKPVGLVWHVPFRLDVTSSLVKGTNTLEVKVTNVWHNRMIGDVQPGVTKRVTYYPVEFFKADSPLLPSGMMGPVTIYGKY